MPKPRRHNLNVDANLNNKISYENVSIDLINKNINIKEENIQNNAKNKLQTNKLFLMPTASTTADTSAPILTNLNDLANAPTKHQKNTADLDEVNKLSNIYNDDANENVKPVAAPRRASTASCTKQFNCAPSTGAISKQPTFDINDFIESPKAKSKNGKQSGNYSFGKDECDNDDFPRKFSLKKRLSDSSISSSTSGNSFQEGKASKHHSPSPG